MSNNPIVKTDNNYFKSKNVKFKRNCDTCGRLYFGWGKHFCSKSCRGLSQPTGENSPSWKGDNISKAQGRGRAAKLFALKPCEICGSTKSERHHIDSNPINNKPDNIMFLCRKHHIKTENRFNKPAH